jgi:chemotaxis regulatin CheY-phosphate phosphatase CheZ
MGSRVKSLTSIVSAIQAMKLITSGDEAYSAFITETTERKADLQEILVVQDFPDIFSIYYSELPLEKEVEFRIDCITGTV